MYVCGRERTRERAWYINVYTCIRRRVFLYTYTYVHTFSYVCVPRHILCHVHAYHIQHLRSYIVRPRTPKHTGRWLQDLYTQIQYTSLSGLCARCQVVRQFCGVQLVPVRQPMKSRSHNQLQADIVWLLYSPVPLLTFCGAACVRAAPAR